MTTDRPFGRSGATPAESLASLVGELEAGALSESSPPRKHTIHDFFIERDLGEGAYAFVKQGRLRSAPAAAPSVVIKMVIKSKLVPECILHDFDLGASLPVELFVLRHLREHPHPNIVSMLDAFADQQYYYIVMPMHGSGEDLFEAIERSPDFLPPQRVAKIFAQAVMTVVHLHTVLGVVHRDIKDENIIIDEHDRIQLIDFGSCAYFRRGAENVQQDVPLTEADIRQGQRLQTFAQFHGTIDYAPPEIVRGLPYDGPQQDIWALGILLYTLSFKEFPFRSPADIREGRLRLPFEPSPQIAAMIRLLLHPDPNLRPSATALAKDPWILEHYRLAMQ